MFPDPRYYLVGFAVAGDGPEPDKGKAARRAKNQSIDLGSAARRRNCFGDITRSVGLGQEPSQREVFSKQQPRPKDKPRESVKQSYRTETTRTNSSAKDVISKIIDKFYKKNQTGAAVSVSENKAAAGEIRKALGKHTKACTRNVGTEISLTSQLVGANTTAAVHTAIPGTGSPGREGARNVPHAAGKSGCRASPYRSLDPAAQHKRQRTMTVCEVLDPTGRRATHKKTGSEAAELGNRRPATVAQNYKDQCIRRKDAYIVGKYRPNRSQVQERPPKSAALLAKGVYAIH